jgi:hypothetical protein
VEESHQEYAFGAESPFLGAVKAVGINNGVTYVDESNPFIPGLQRQENPYSSSQSPRN